MKAKFVTALILSVLIPLSVSADIASDMNNPELSLVAVMENAIAEGMSVAEAVTQMLAIEPNQSNAIIATAMTVSGDYRAIIGAAVNAGVPPDQAVVAVLIASDGVDADLVIGAGIEIAPESSDAIVAASTSVLPETAEGVAEVISAVAETAAETVTNDGGAASTAIGETDIYAASAEVQTALVEIKSELVAAGFTEEEADAEVTAIKTSLNETQGDVATAITTVQETIASPAGEAPS